MAFDDDEAAGPPEAAPQALDPPAYRAVVAGWPEDWRERWGRRANALEEDGLSWRDAESQAFVEVWDQFRRGSHDRDRPRLAPEPGRN